MVENKPSSNGEQTKLEILKLYMDYNGRYHDHKETMAWVITAFYIVGVISMALAVRDIASNCCSWRIFFSLFFAISGSIILFLVWWQFQKRYIASERVIKCHKELLEMEIVKKTGVDWVSESASEPRVTERFSFLAIIAVTAVAITLVNWY